MCYYIAIGQRIGGQDEPMGDMLKAVEGIVFDLDDTLLSKSDWTVPALEFASSKLGLDSQRVWELVTKYIQQRGAADAGVYNHVLLECGQSDSALNIRALSAWANQFEPSEGSLNLMPGVREALVALSKRYRLAVIADGPVACQKAKVRATRLERMINTIIYSDAIDGIRSRRPDPRPFRMVLGELGTRAAHTLFIGDNPVRDFQRPRAMGFVTVRVMTGEYENFDYPSPEHSADYEISSAARLPDLLADAPEPRSHCHMAESKLDASGRLHPN
jgi:putative hydrolase of the HAD superfamily